MSDEIGTYSFLPWLRQGIANKISNGDMDPSVVVRASVDITLEVTGSGLSDEPLVETVPKKVALYGPGDIIGVESRAIIKNEPRNWITNFEPNYLPYIDFYDEDLPWRYTPAAPDLDRQRLRPWIMLVVLREDEFTDGKNISDKPLSYIEVPSASDIFPSADQLWAWAHVHINEDIVLKEDHILNGNTDEVLPRFRETLARDPDLAYSRIVCPRKLEANIAYHAFLIPVFERGRLAGLGLDPNSVPEGVHATTSAWSSYSEKPDSDSYPYYHRWYFRTGAVGDFEYLVRLLEPKPVDSRVGRRDMDVLDPAPNIQGIDDEELAGVLKLGGALQIPYDSLSPEELAEVKKYDNWAQDYPHRFQSDLATFINLADDFEDKGVADALSGTDFEDEEEGDPDPLITAPIYGRWHAMIKRLLVERNGSATSPNKNWVHELNLDPRWRVSAGFGTRVIQDKQENYMDAAWGQVGDIIAANRKMRLAQLSKQASFAAYNKHLLPLQAMSVERAFMLIAPLQRRVLHDNKTVFYQVKGSRIPHASLSAPMRRVIRPRSRLMRTLPFDQRAKPDNLLERINQEEVFPAPPRTVPETLPSLDDLAEGIKPDNVPGFLLDLLSKYPLIQYLPLLFALILIVLILLFNFTGAALNIAMVLIAASLYFFRQLRNWTNRVDAADSVVEGNQTPEAVEELPHSPDFRLTDIDEGFKPSVGLNDSPEAQRFKDALRDNYELIQLSGEAGSIPKRQALAIPAVTDGMLKGIDPMVTIPRLVLNQILIPNHIMQNLRERFVEAMAYPEFDIPMYKPLLDISTELFLPNINHVAQNSISLLETNQKFIEAYMVGLNHEFARELLWREFPTDQRGSYFRQFWDVSSYLNTEDLDEAALKEKLRDIPPLHRWSKYSELGEHDNRETDGEVEEEAVLVIRGELLKKYPTAVIYAHRAQWERNDDGTIDTTRERTLVVLTEEEQEKPPRSKVKTPLYEAQVEPDIYFFGFDLTIEEARGGIVEEPDDEPNPGWFFIIKERPGEPRFGLDVDAGEQINVWNDLAWSHIIPGDPTDQYITISDSTEAINLTDPSADPELAEKVIQYNEDRHLTWHKDMNAAELAYILYQVPVLVAVHASEMLSRD